MKIWVGGQGGSSLGEGGIPECPPLFETLLLSMSVYMYCFCLGASLLDLPLLCPRLSHLYSGPHSMPQLIERTGAVVTLPSDHRLPLAHYLLHQQDLTYLKR